MKSCLILGCGRSGTSLTAGLLASAGYFMGDDLLTPRPSNPKGFFEDRKVNTINEALLKPLLPWRPPVIWPWVLRDRVRQGQRWLVRVPVGTDVPCPSQLAARIRERISHKPFCFKDPRLCYTLPAWRPQLSSTVFVCVFRDPAQTIDSILRECRMPYLRDLRFDAHDAAEVWQLIYEHILQTHRHEGEWLFVHTDQLLEQPGRDRLAAFVEAEIDHDFAERELVRSARGETPSNLVPTYRQLCALASFDLPLD